MVNQVVARFLDGRILKGQTNDFLPTKNLFHVTEDGALPGSKPAEIRVPDLKALYFVRTLSGDPNHQEAANFSDHGVPPGRKIRLTFKDGEVMLGTTQGYQPDRPGFFILPADPKSNNERCFVVMAATQSVTFV